MWAVTLTQRSIPQQTQQTPAQLTPDRQGGVRSNTKTHVIVQRAEAGVHHDQHYPMHARDMLVSAHSPHKVWWQGRTMTSAGCSRHTPHSYSSSSQPPSTAAAAAGGLEVGGRLAAALPPTTPLAAAGGGLVVGGSWLVVELAPSATAEGGWLAVGLTGTHAAGAVREEGRSAEGRAGPSAATGASARETAGGLPSVPSGVDTLGPPLPPPSTTAPLFWCTRIWE